VAVEHRWPAARGHDHLLDEEVTAALVSGRATPRGGQLYAIAREVVAELEAEWTRRLGKAKMRQLRALLEELNAAL
jgi:hypothetical protein